MVFKSKPNCLRGHPLSDENVYIYGGKKTCRVCHELRMRKIGKIPRETYLANRVEAGAIRRQQEDLEAIPIVSALMKLIDGHWPIASNGLLPWPLTKKVVAIYLGHTVWGWSYVRCVRHFSAATQSVRNYIRRVEEARDHYEVDTNLEALEAELDALQRSLRNGEGAFGDENFLAQGKLGEE